MSLVVGSTGDVFLRGHRNNHTREYDQEATVTATYYDANDDPVTGATAIAMPFVEGTSGPSSRYEGVVPSTAAFTAGTYTRKITATSAAGVRIYTESVEVTE